MNDYNDILFLKPENSKFYLTKNGFAAMEAYLPAPVEDDLNESAEREYKWRDVGRVFFHLAFPFEFTDKYISVSNKDGEEYGMIEDVGLFDSETVAVISEAVKRKYFMPTVRKINKIKEQFGFSHWSVETDIGNIDFTVRDTYKSMIRLSDTRVIVCDADGGRYVIEDVLALDRKSYRKIELYL